MTESSQKAISLKWIGLGFGLGFGVIVLLAIIPAWFPHPAWNSFFRLVCHQIPERSHQLDGNPFGVCVRCFWLYCGLVTGHFRFGFSQWIPKWRLKFLIVTLTVSLLNWVFGWLSLAPDFVFVRALSGFFLGNAIALFTVSGLRDLIFNKTNSTRDCLIQSNHENE